MIEVNAKSANHRQTPREPEPEPQAADNLGPQICVWFSSSRRYIVIQECVKEKD